MDVENIITLFENENIYAFSENEIPDFQFGNRDYPGPLICIQKTELTDANLAFLEKIIKAIGFELTTQCELVVLDILKKYSFRDLLKTPSSGQTILFGNFKDQLDLNLHISLNEWITTGNFLCMFSFSLEELQKDTLKKQGLWQSLKMKYQ